MTLHRSWRMAVGASLSSKRASWRRHPLAARACLFLAGAAARGVQQGGHLEGRLGCGGATPPSTRLAGRRRADVRRRSVGVRAGAEWAELGAKPPALRLSRCTLRSRQGVSAAARPSRASASPPHPLWRGAGRRCLRAARCACSACKPHGGALWLLEVERRARRQSARLPPMPQGAAAQPSRASFAVARPSSSHTRSSRHCTALSLSPTTLSSSSPQLSTLRCATTSTLLRVAHRSP
jgi:hypothetical protein